MLLLVDLDGVVYRGANPVPGVAAVLAARAALGDDVVYVTNNSMWHRTDYVARLEGMGAPVHPDRIVSSARATALYLNELEPAVRRALVVGAPGLVRELEDAGIVATTAQDAVDRRAVAGPGRPAVDALEAAGHPDAVVVGLDRELTYARIAIASEVIRLGIRFVATNRDPVYPAEHGFLPGAGAVVAAIEAASGVHPVSLGKPGAEILEVAARSVGARAGDAVVVGDGLGTDLAAAQAVGARSVLMLTGVTSADQVRALPPDRRPTLVAADADELAAALRSLAPG